MDKTGIYNTFSHYLLENQNNQNNGIHWESGVSGCYPRPTLNNGYNKGYSRNSRELFKAVPSTGCSRMSKYRPRFRALLENRKNVGGCIVKWIVIIIIPQSLLSETYYSRFELFLGLVAVARRILGDTECPVPNSCCSCGYKEFFCQSDKFFCQKPQVYLEELGVMETKSGTFVKH